MKETRAFNRLWEHSNKMQTLQKEAIFRKIGGTRDAGFDAKKHASLNDQELERMTQAEVSALTNITEETNLLKEIKDILDELSSILLIYKQQETLVDTMGEDEDLDSDEELSQELSSPTSIADCRNRSRIKRSHARLTRTIKEHEREIEMLEVEAVKTHDAVCTNTD
jgi:pantothenate kinase